MSKGKKTERGLVKANPALSKPISPAQQARIINASGPHPAPQVAIHQVHESITAHSGPIPSAESLAEYDAVMDGLAGRIVGWAENEIEHRHALESKLADAEIEHLKASDKDARLGLWFALVVALAILGVAGLMAWNDKAWPALLLSAGTVVGLVSTFIYGTRTKSSKKNRPVAHPPAPPEKKQ